MFGFESEEEAALAAKITDELGDTSKDDDRTPGSSRRWPLPQRRFVSISKGREKGLS